MRGRGRMGESGRMRVGWGRWVERQEGAVRWFNGRQSERGGRRAISGNGHTPSSAGGATDSARTPGAPNGKVHVGAL
jgi:hypothetical protein